MANNFDFDAVHAYLLDLCQRLRLMAGEAPPGTNPRGQNQALVGTHSSALGSSPGSETGQVLRSLAADIATALIQQHACLHLFDHGHLLAQEMSWRAGGLPLVHVLDPDQVLSPVVVRPGDWVIIASVSGRAADVVEIALTLRQRGVKVVALTSLEQSRAAPPAHPSGQMLYQVVDGMVDLPIPAGDALLQIPGLTERVAPASGVLSVAAMWALLAQIAAELLARGVQPTVFRSVNLPGGQELFEQAVARYRARGL